MAHSIPSYSENWARAGVPSWTIDTKAGNYTIISTDNGHTINYTSGTFTVSLDAAATLGVGFKVAITNNGAGTITVDPNGAEVVFLPGTGGDTTLTLAAGKKCLLICNGYYWEMALWQ